MDIEGCIQHARSVSRYLIEFEVADKETLRKHYEAYTGYLKQGFFGSFTQLLSHRRVISREAAEQLELVHPFGKDASSLTAKQDVESFGSMRISLPEVRKAAEQAAAARAAAQRSPAPSPQPASTMGFDEVLPAPGQRGGGQRGGGQRGGGLGGSTMGFDEVLPSPGQRGLGGSTMGFDEVLPSPGGRAGRTMGFNEVIPAPGGRAGGTMGFNEVIPAPGPFGGTMGFNEVIPSPGGRTVGFDEVLPPDGEGPPPIDVSTSIEELTFPELERPPGLLMPPKPAPAEPPSAESFDPTASWSGQQSAVPSTAGDPSSHATPPPSDTHALFGSGSGSGSGDGEGSDESGPRVGSHLGEFELIEVIGQGGMGTVFRGRHATSGADYALKVLRLRARGSQAKRRERFRREIDALQRLEHENIVKVHGYGREGNFDYYVMDYVEGVELSQILREDQLDHLQRLELFAQICAAIAHSHEHDVVHRDLKPGNVLIDSELKAHVLDFGLAKLTDAASALTMTGSALGTPYYMSPEQVADATKVGPKTDVFALGVVLYELATGQRPFTGQSAGEVGNKILTHDPPLPSSMAKDLPAGVDAICMKALEKKASRRYESVAALRADVVSLLEGKGVRGSNQLVGKVRRAAERHRQGIMIGMGATLAVVILGSLFVIFLYVFLS